MAKIVMANVLLTGAAKDAFGSTLVRAAVPHPEDSPAAFYINLYADIKY
jgi:hypothetical protein